MIEVVAYLSAVANVSELKESLNVAKELRESIAESVAGAKVVLGGTLISGVTDKQTELALQLQVALSTLRILALGTVSPSVTEVEHSLQRAVEVVEQLDKDLASIAKTKTIKTAMQQATVEEAITDIENPEHIKVITSEQDGVYVTGTASEEVPAFVFIKPIAAESTHSHATENIEKRYSQDSLVEIVPLLETPLVLERNITINSDVTDKIASPGKEIVLHDQEIKGDGGGESDSLKNITNFTQVVELEPTGDISASPTVTDGLQLTTLDQTVPFEYQSNQEWTQNLEDRVAKDTACLAPIARNEQPVQYLIKDGIEIEHICKRLSSESGKETEQASIPELISEPAIILDTEVTTEELLLIGDVTSEKVEKILEEPNKDTYNVVSSGYLSAQVKREELKNIATSDKVPGDKNTELDSDVLAKDEEVDFKLKERESQHVQVSSDSTCDKKLKKYLENVATDILESQELISAETESSVCDSTICELGHKLITHITVEGINGVDDKDATVEHTALSDTNSNTIEVVGKYSQLVQFDQVVDKLSETLAEQSEDITNEKIPFDTKVEEIMVTFSDILAENIVVETAPLVFEQAAEKNELVSKDVSGNVTIKDATPQETELRPTADVLSEQVTMRDSSAAQAHVGQNLNIVQTNYGNLRHFLCDVVFSGCILSLQ